MTYIRCLGAGLVLVLSACGSQPEAPVPAVRPNTPWTCVGDLDRAWHCARGRVPSVQQSGRIDQPERIEQPGPVVEKPEPEISQSGSTRENPGFAGTAADVAGAVKAIAAEISLVNPAQDVQSGNQDAVGQSRVSDEQAILAAPDSYYAVQVVAANSAEAVAGYLKATAADGAVNAQNVRIWSRGRDWYVGIAGIYPDSASAGAAAATLPATATPWVRPVKGLKQAILAARAPSRQPQ